MLYEEDINLIAVDSHRNGIGGAPYYVVLFEDKSNNPGQKMLCFIFPEGDGDYDRERVACVDIDEAVLGNIYMHTHTENGKPVPRTGGNAFRSADYYGPILFQMAKAILDARYAHMWGEVDDEPDS